MLLPSLHLWQIARIGRPLSVHARDWAGDDGGALSIVQGGAFQWQSMTAKGTLGGQVYGPASTLGKLALGPGCNSNNVDDLRACQEQQGAAAATSIGTFVAIIGTAIGGPLVGAGLSALWGAFVKAVGIAEAGYGTCDDRSQGAASYVVDPSTDWRSWPYQFFEGQGRAGFHAAPVQLGDPGSFESFANTMIQADWANGTNCAPPCPNHACGPVAPALGPALTLAQAIATWNATHGADTQRTISRSNLSASMCWGYNCSSRVIGYDQSDGWGDAIGFALRDGLDHQNDQTTQEAHFTINDGAAVSLAKLFGGAAIQAGPPALHLSGRALSVAATQTSPGASSGPSLGTVAVVGGAGLLALALFKPALFRGVPLLGKLGGR